MIVVIAVIGLLIGTLLVWASDYLPRFSESYAAPANVAAVKFAPVPHVLRWLLAKIASVKQGPPSRWLLLHIGTELLSAFAFAFFYRQYGLSLSLLFYGTVFGFLCLIAVVDIKYRLVLNVLTYPAIVIVLIGQLLLARHGVLIVMLGGGLAFGIFFLTARLKPGDLGGGDIKLATLIGLAFGFPGVLFALIVGAGTGAFVAILLFTRRHGEKVYFPYAPFLCLGAIVALLYNPFLTI
jgi:prepilin signal peptidase PulO-like enzyme (type II secretory pathway)